MQDNLGQPPPHPTLVIHTKRVMTMRMYQGGIFPAATLDGTLDGHPLRLRWGANPLLVAPGVHDLRIHVRYLWSFGHAQLTVDNRAGPVTVYYAAPAGLYKQGAIAFQPVQPPGLAVGIVVPLVFVTLPVLFFIVVPLLVVVVSCLLGGLASD